MRYGLFCGHRDSVLAAHIHSEGLGDADAAVLVEIVLEECDEHSRGSHNGIVEGVGKVVAVFALDADAETSCLSIAQIRAGANLKIFLNQIEFKSAAI